MGAEATLSARDIQLPEPPAPGGNYRPWRQVGSLFFLSGHGPEINGQAITGKVGADLDIAAGQKAARHVGLNLLATTRAALGSLDRVKSVVKVLGLVNAALDFDQHPAVINGFSDLMVEVFGEEIGKHTRSAVGAGSLPGQIAVEIEMILEVEV